MRVIDSLKMLQDVYHARNMEYGSSYKRFGNILLALFPAGIHIKEEMDGTRVAILLWILSKLDRYVSNFENGGHPDSLDDMAVYAMMLKEIDDDERQRKGQAGKDM